ncbi:hypothetical protein ABZ920_26475 [Streptomyces sp. NPDC046831]
MPTHTRKPRPAAFPLVTGSLGTYNITNTAELTRVAIDLGL